MQRPGSMTILTCSWSKRETNVAKIGMIGDNIQEIRGADWLGLLFPTIKLPLNLRELGRL